MFFSTPHQNADLHYCLKSFEYSIITNIATFTKQLVHCYMKYCRYLHFIFMELYLYIHQKKKIKKVFFLFRTELFLDHIAAHQIVQTTLNSQMSHFCDKTNIKPSHYFLLREEYLLLPVLPTDKWCAVLCASGLQPRTLSLAKAKSG